LNFGCAKKAVFFGVLVIDETSRKVPTCTYVGVHEDEKEDVVGKAYVA
jgi:hypothetical protein